MKDIVAKLSTAWELPLVILIGAALRCWAARESLWLDELHTAWCLEGSWSDVAQRAMLGNNSPLYFQCAWLWTRVVGLSEWALRAPSVLAGLGVIACIYCGVRRWTGQRGTAAAAALCAALDGHFIFYAVEARPYAAVQLVATLHILLFIEQLQHQVTARWRVAFVATASLLIYLHYTLALLLAAELLTAMALLATGHLHRDRLIRLMVDMLLVGVLCLGAVNHARAVFERRADWSGVVDVPNWKSVFRIWHGGWYLVPALLLICIDRFGPVRSRATPTDRRLQTAGLFCLWLIPLAISWGATAAAIAPLLLPRYLIGASAAPILLASTIQYSMRPLRVVAAIVLVTTAALLAGYPQWLAGAQPKLIHVRYLRMEDWRTLKRRLAAGDRDPILLRAGLIEADRLAREQDPLFYDYCRLPLLTMSPPPRARERVFPLRLSSPRLVVAGAELALQESDYAWLIVRRAERESRPLVADIMQEPALRAFQVRDWESFGQLQAIRLERRSPR